MVVVRTQTEARDVEMTMRSNEYQLVTQLQSQIETLEGTSLFLSEGERLRFGIKAPVSRYKVHCLSQGVGHYPEDSSLYSNTSLMMRALHMAFARHIPYSLNPDAIWYTIAHELAVHIHQNQDRYRGYFTVSGEKETLQVRDDSLVYDGDPDQWVRSLQLIREPMRAKVPRATMDLLMPEFTTSTEETRMASLVLFLNILANYYAISWTTWCGIPTIRIEGDSADWNKIIAHAELASREFDGLQEYFADLIPVLKEIAGVANGDEPDPEFWCSMYKYKSRSGGNGINGWITTLIAHHKFRDGRFELKKHFDWRAMAENDGSWGPASLSADFLPSHVSSVPFQWNHLGKVIEMIFVTGFMGMTHDGFLNPQLGFGVLEKQPMT